MTATASRSSGVQRSSGCVTPSGGNISAAWCSGRDRPSPPTPLICGTVSPSRRSPAVANGSMTTFATLSAAATQRCSHGSSTGSHACCRNRPNAPKFASLSAAPRKAPANPQLGRVLMRLLGQHAFSITDPRHLVGGFNAHLRDCVFLLGDEAFYAGDKAHVGILKTIITEPTLTIEGKFRDAILVPNFLHVMLTANAEWVVPASLSARRFLVLDASSRHVGDHDYFRTLWSELEAGGFAAFLYDMLRRDLCRFNWRQPPDTVGLQEQKKRSLATELAWWKEVLHRGYVWPSKLGLEDYFAEWHDAVATELLFASYQEFAKSHHEWSPLSREDLGKFLRKLGEPAGMRNAVVSERITDVNTDGGGVRREAASHIRKRAHGYRFGPLKDARAAFTSHTRLTIEWEPVDDLFPDA